MTTAGQSDDRLLFLLQTVEKEGRHLTGTTERLFADTIDAIWVQRLEDHPELAERTDAFATRFGRMQDTLGDKLIPELRRRLVETPGAALGARNVRPATVAPWFGRASGPPPV